MQRCFASCTTLVVALALVSFASAGCPSTSQCNCGWAQNGCGVSDGSTCWKTCCACAGSPSPAPQPGPAPAPGPVSSGGWAGTAKTTRYWDCCKPSCSWQSNVPSNANRPVRSCDINGREASPNAINVCGGGGDRSKGASYTCIDNLPSALPDGTLTAFVASNTKCCECSEIEFTEGPVAGMRMVIQTTNSGADLGAKHFDIMMPGGGLGIFNGCSGNAPNGRGQFSAPESAWGARYGGVSSRSACDGLPSEIRAGCYWRFDAFKNANNPSAKFRRVQCPTQLTSKSLCKLSDDSSYPLPGQGLPAPAPAPKPQPAPAPGPQPQPTPAPAPAPGPTGGAFSVSWNGGSNAWWICFAVSPAARTMELDCGQGYSSMYKVDWADNTWVSDTQSRGSYPCNGAMKLRKDGVQVQTTGLSNSARAVTSQLTKTTLIKLTLGVDFSAIPEGTVQRSEFVLQLSSNVAISLKTEISRVEVIAVEAGSVIASVIFMDPIPGGDTRPGAALSRELYQMTLDRNSTLYQQQLTSAITGSTCDHCNNRDIDLVSSTFYGVPVLAIALPIVVFVALAAVGGTAFVYRRRMKRREHDIELTEKEHHKEVQMVIVEMAPPKTKPSRSQTVA
mmetsp:Transcript_13541/g.31167  ORF Transcript_13541/g.31167 Transcript_13541/m.31167 type:complete len:618 (+) Transcript_13541:25-1878(+)